MPPRVPDEPVQRVLEFATLPALDRSSLFTSPANRHAVEWIDRWPDWPHPALALYGPEGCGKTHLARIWQGRAAARLVQPEALTDALLNDFVVRPSAVVIDDADRALGTSEQRLFHLYNLVVETGQFLLLTGRTPPSRYGARLPDLASRLGAVQAIAIAQPDDDLLLRVLGKLFSDRQLMVPEDVIPYLLTRMERSFAAAERIVTRLDQLSLVHKRPITLALARAALEQDNTTEAAGP